MTIDKQDFETLIFFSKIGVVASFGAGILVAYGGSKAIKAIAKKMKKNNKSNEIVNASEEMNS